MSNYQNIPSLRKYVLVKKEKNIEELKKAGLEWVRASSENKLSYEIDWLGVPVIQTPEDLILIQELIFKIRPDFIIETGIAHGGGLIYYASLLELLGKGRVIGVDIDVREHNRKVIEAHPLFKRIEIIEGNSVSDEIIQELRKKILNNSKVIVCLDSNHAKTHVLRELELYQNFVIPGCYVVVFDTIADGPKEAVDEFLKMNNHFEIDKDFNKLYVSYNPSGYLKRIK